MKPHTEAELTAMRERWALNLAQGEAEPCAPITPEELAQLNDDKLARRKAESLRIAAHHRAEAIEADAAGEPSVAKALRALASKLEALAALAEAERRDRATKARTWRTSQVNSSSAQRERPSRKPQIRDRIIEMMKTEKAAGAQFKTLLRRWEREPIAGLRLVEIEPGRYAIDDEDAVGVEGQYKTTTLEKFFSLAG